MLNTHRIRVNKLYAEQVVQLPDQVGHARDSMRPQMFYLGGGRKDICTMLVCSGLTGEG